MKPHPFASVPRAHPHVILNPRPSPFLTNCHEPALREPILSPVLFMHVGDPLLNLLVPPYKSPLCAIGRIQTHHHLHSPCRVDDSPYPFLQREVYPAETKNSEQIMPGTHALLIHRIYWHNFYDVWNIYRCQNSRGRYKRKKKVLADVTNVKLKN